jgi:hypothetical protein
MTTKVLRDYYELEKFVEEVDEIFRRLERREMNEIQAQQALYELQRKYPHNQLVSILTNKSLTQHEKKMLIDELMDQEEPRLRIGEMLYLSQLAIFLACFLAIADQVVGRNWRATVINGSVGVLLGLIGGVIVWLFIDRLYHSLGGGRLDGPRSTQMLARTIAWGVLGLFLAIAPGVVLRSPKRLCIGLAGGLVGGLLGGLLFDPLSEAAESGRAGRFIALGAIGVLTGVATGLIEQAAKGGWLRVTAGLITGKQFILYRNPTYIGSSPQCEIYLFKDLQISPRHAAIHRIPGGFELEDLHSTTGTLVNGKPVTRARLHKGDHVQIGSTCFLFQERARAAV